jgi:hypothetical protein
LEEQVLQARQLSNRRDVLKAADHPEFQVGEWAQFGQESEIARAAELDVE